MTEMHHEGTMINIDASAGDNRLKGGAVGLIGVLFLCVTGSAPLAVTLFNTPYVGPLGSGYGAPGAFLFATIVLTIFSVAYVQMCLKVRAAGGMYTFVSRGLGRSLGMMSGFSLMIAYTLFGASLIGGFATFTQNTLSLHLGLDGIPWIWLALFAVAVVVVLGYFDVEISVKVLGVALVGEMIVIGIFTLGTLFQGGADGLNIAALSPLNGVTTGVAPGIGVFFAFWSWVGFEAAPNYAEESKDPVRTIPVAVYFSCIGVGVLYTLMMWAVVSAYGHGDQISTAFAAGVPVTLNGYTFVPDGTTLVTGPMTAYVGSFFASAMDWLIVTGSLACASALTNAGLRYWYAMGREGILPRALGRTHPAHKTPHIAILTVGVLNALLCLAFWFTNHLPIEMYGWLAVQGVVWIVLVQALTALSTFVYFRRNHRDEMSGLGGVLKLVAAPWIGFLAQIFVLLLAYHNLYFLASLAGNVYVGPRFELFAGTNAELQFNLLGIIGVLVPLIGLAWALTIRSTNPAKYELMGHFVNEGGA
jgi:amino acid transporter